MILLDASTIDKGLVPEGSKNSVESGILVPGPFGKHNKKAKLKLSGGAALPDSISKHISQKIGIIISLKRLNTQKGIPSGPGDDVDK